MYARAHVTSREHREDKRTTRPDKNIPRHVGRTSPSMWGSLRLAPIIILTLNQLEPYSVDKTKGEFELYINGDVALWLDCHQYSQPGLFRRVLALQCLFLVYTVVTLFTNIGSTWNFYRSILAAIFHLDLQNLNQ